MLNTRGRVHDEKMLSSYPENILRTLIIILTEKCLENSTAISVFCRTKSIMLNITTAKALLIIIVTQLRAVFVERTKFDVSRTIIKQNINLVA